MAIRRVFVIWTHPLFLESVRRLLASPEIQWLGATSDHRTAQAQAVQAGADTILVEADQNDPGEVAQMLDAGQADLKVIRLNLEENVLYVYHREQHTVAQAGDLLQLISVGAVTAPAAGSQPGIPESMLEKNSP